MGHLEDIGIEFKETFERWLKEDLLYCDRCLKNLKEEINEGKQIQMLLEVNHDNNKNMIVIRTCYHPHPNFCSKKEEING